VFASVAKHCMCVYMQIFLCACVRACVRVHACVCVCVHSNYVYMFTTHAYAHMVEEQ